VAAEAEGVIEAVSVKDFESLAIISVGIQGRG